MSDFPLLTLTECADRIVDTKNPLVVMHIRPDGDTVGSCAALCEIFKALGREVKYICDDKIPERLSFLTKDLEAAEGTDGYDAVSIDVASPSQMGGLADRVNIRFSIDHHAVNTPFAPNYTVPDASSAGEVLFGVAKELEARGLIEITDKIAYPLYAAISSDTGCFAFSNSSAATHRSAAELIAIGIDQADINHRLFMSKSRLQILAEGYTASAMKSSDDGKIAYAVISLNDMRALGVDGSYFDTAIDVVRSLADVEIAFVIKESERGFKASMRSVGANVAEGAAHHGGGGHIRAAGCTVEAESAEDAAKILLEELKSIL